MLEDEPVEPDPIEPDPIEPDPIEPELDMLESDVMAVSALDPIEPDDAVDDDLAVLDEDPFEIEGGRLVASTSVDEDLHAARDARPKSPIHTGRPRNWLKSFIQFTSDSVPVAEERTVRSQGAGG